MNQKTLISLVVAAVVVLLGLNSYVVVEPGQQALITRLGKLQAEALTPGFHARLPFIDRVTLIDSRHRVSTLPNFTLGKGAKQASVDAFAVWQVADARRYVKAVGSDSLKADVIDQLALRHLGQVVNDALQKQLGAKTVVELAAGHQRATLDKLTQHLGKSLLSGYGIKLDRLSLLSVNWPKTARNSVYQQMQARLSDTKGKHLTEKRAELANIKAQTRTQTSVALADARRKAQQIKADGDAKAASIYADAYGKAPKFYAFYRSLKAYRASFNSKQDVLVLNTDSDFFRYFKHLDGKHD